MYGDTKSFYQTGGSMPIYKYLLVAISQFIIYALNNKSMFPLPSLLYNPEPPPKYPLPPYKNPFNK